MGDPAIVAFYDKRIYKKSRKETASEYDKINNCAMIRPPPSFRIIEGRLCSVRTVINILHFFKPINCIYMYMYHMKTGIFQTD
jgi:hypothetical protein